MVKQRKIYLTDDNVKIPQIVKVKIDKPKSPKKEKHGEKVKLTKEEYYNLCEEFSQSQIESIIKDMNEYLLINGKSYKNYNLAIRKWLKNDNSKKTTEIDYENDFDWGD